MKTVSTLFVLVLLRTVGDVDSVVPNNTVSNYDPSELLSRIFKPNITIETRQRNSIKFEGQPDHDSDSDYQDPGQYGLVDFERDPRPIKFEDDYDNENYDPNFDTSENDINQNAYRPLKFEDSEYNQDLSATGGQVTFQDDNKVDDQGNKTSKKRRRRRKPKNSRIPTYYSGSNGYLASRPGQASVQGGYGLYLYGNANEHPGVQPIRRPRRPRPRPSIASEALSSITEALTSIALYDDYQCVPRLLCEAAGGGSFSDSGVLQSIAGIQPLLTLLSAYNGISTSPLFVFGRAVFLGMTSKGNTGTCRYAYPQCPTDPEQLIYYLNNHNGGFFRFFNAPQPQNQNLEQFYNQLGQGYGFYQPNPAQQNLHNSYINDPNPPQQNYGYINDPNPPQQNYGYINDPNRAQQNYGYINDPDSAQKYGLYQNNQNYQRPYLYPNSGVQTYESPGLYGNNVQNYESNYAYGYNDYGNHIRYQDARIEKRIQNRPSQTQDDDNKTNWHFPDSTTEYVNKNNYKKRDSHTLKFPEDGQDFDNKQSIRKGKQIQYQNQNNNNRYNFYENNRNRYETTPYPYNYDQQNQNNYNNPLNIYTNNYYKFTTPGYNNYDNYNNNYNYENNNHNYYNNLQNIYNSNKKYQPTVFNNEEYVFDHKHNFYIKKENNYGSNLINNNKHDEDNGLKTVYIVRGNGDPNKPEIVKLRPGQSLPLY